MLKKTHLIRFKPYNLDNSTFSIFVDGNGIFECSSVKYLGIHLQSNLSWNIHIQYIKNKISQAIGLLFEFKNKFDRKTKMLIYYALIQSQLSYLIILYGSRKTTDIKSLQRMQNKALKSVFNLPIMYPTVSLYEDVVKSVLPIMGIYKLQLLLYVFKCIHNIGHHTVQFRINQHSIETRNNASLLVAWCRLETTKQRIEYIETRESNNLPPSLKNINRISVFKTKLKEYLYHSIPEFL